MNIGFIGIGKLGKEAAEVMAEKHYVEGYDITEIQSDYFKTVLSLEEVCKDKELIFIAVPTPHHPDYDGRYPTSHLPNKDFDYSIVNNVLDEVNKYVSKDQLIVLISTVLPGTIRREFIDRISNGRFIYNPYLIAMGTVKWDMINPEMIIIGTEDGSTTGDAKLLLEFYETFVTEGTRYEIGTWDEAEAIKIFYNTFISTKVALVNMMQDVAERSGNMNVDVVTQALERSTYRITGKTYMKAGMGDGGGCHPRDNIALSWLSNNLDLSHNWFDNIMKQREFQTDWFADLIEEHCEDRGINILGKSFKPETNITTGSPSILLKNILEERGHGVFMWDPYIDEPWEEIKQKYDDSDNETDSHLYFIGTKHPDFTDFPFEDGSVVIDPWRYIPESDKYKLISIGIGEGYEG